MTAKESPKKRRSGTKKMWDWHDPRSKSLLRAPSVAAAPTTTRPMVVNKPMSLGASERAMEAARCTCPVSAWVGSEPNDSTCELTIEQHEALSRKGNMNITRKHFVCRGCTEPIVFVNGVWRHVFFMSTCLPAQPPLCLIQRDGAPLPSDQPDYPHDICEKPMLHDGFHMASQAGGGIAEWPQYFDQKSGSRTCDLSDPMAVIHGLPVDKEPSE